MAFVFTDDHIEDYHKLGYTVFRGILPASLVADLRRVTDHARQVAREANGGQVQRLQPVTAYEQLDQQPFQDYNQLPALVDAVQSTLGPQYRPSNLSALGILLEPADHPWCTQWHRDWRDNMSGLDLVSWEADFRDPELFNQVNCALYEDGSTWVVPGSHQRHDLPREIERFPHRPIEKPDVSDLEAAEAERVCWEYVVSMPGAQQLVLGAGDYCLYRNSLWHIGNYVPYRRRATLHDAADTERFIAWRDEHLAAASKRREAGAGIGMPPTR
ncbi:MAG: hypothetical protein HOM68_09440 [Gemmatimonadetes bacterium]|jgi:hypothetical protein|nr:hypothetical protein [Gemmatimonadota bacterium]MBT4608794.1 hypothetical protein [Gemmatimonadota bacterium]MBT5056752.1 hypothetical protein [Gemmatimonadota bacterium]MBT5146654.1 hypothetical protein [Gemmatimonadota bacterium]MBT5587919.1 hypothetical protein [Gemmatimonadota bacterium]